MKKIIIILVMCCISLQCIGAGWRLKSKSAKLPRRSSVNYRFSRALERAQHKYVVTHNLRGKVTVRETLKRTEPARPLKLRSKEEMENEYKRLSAQLEGVEYPLITRRQRQMRYQAGILNVKIPFYDELNVEDIKAEILEHDLQAKKTSNPVMRELVETLKWMINAREKLPEPPLKLRSKGEMEAKIETLSSQLENKYYFQFTDKDVQTRCQLSILKRMQENYDKLKLPLLKKWILKYEAPKDSKTSQYMAETLKWIIGAREELPTRPLKLRSKEELKAKMQTLATQLENKYRDQFTPKDIQVHSQRDVLKRMIKDYDKLDVSLVEEWMLAFEDTAKKAEDPIIRHYAETLKWIINAREDLPVDE